jgi:hypothetical protein
MNDVWVVGVVLDDEVNRSPTEPPVRASVSARLRPPGCHERTQVGH